METPNPGYAIQERRLLRNGLENGFCILDCLWYLLQAGGFPPPPGKDGPGKEASGFRQISWSTQWRDYILVCVLSSLQLLMGAK